MNPETQIKADQAVISDMLRDISEAYSPEDLQRYGRMLYHLCQIQKNHEEITKN